MGKHSNAVAKSFGLLLQPIHTGILSKNFEKTIEGIAEVLQGYPSSVAKNYADAHEVMAVGQKLSEEATALVSSDKRNQGEVALYAGICTTHSEGQLTKISLLDDILGDSSATLEDTIKTVHVSN